MEIRVKSWQAQNVGKALARYLQRAAARAIVIAPCYAMLYGLGLRVGEAPRLCAGDVDLVRQLLFIRDTKFSKSRLAGC